MLERLAAHRTFDDLVQSVMPEDLSPIMPRIVHTAEGSMIVMPGGAQP
jgi:hypothetical protein